MNTENIGNRDGETKKILVIGSLNVDMDIGGHLNLLEIRRLSWIRSPHRRDFRWNFTEKRYTRFWSGKSQNEERRNYVRKRKLSVRLKLHWQLYLMLAPAVLYIAIFHYIPIYGLLGAFENFKPYKGYLGSDWVGLQHFKRFFTSNAFGEIVPNTIRLSLYSLLAGFPLPIILALCLNYIPSMRFKKIVQNITYAPHFISVVVIVSMIQTFFGLQYGLINNVREMFGLERVFFMSSEALFPHIYVWSGVWQGVGWGSIIYISALSGVDQELHESAIVDGASILQRIRYIDIPSILPVAVTLLIMNTGHVMSVGFDKVYLMQNSLNLGVSEVISTYVYKQGLVNTQYGYSTAVGLFTAVVNLIMLVTVNTISKKINETSVW